jgi:hypothetical protein
MQKETGVDRLFRELYLLYFMLCGRLGIGANAVGAGSPQEIDSN